MEACSVAHPAYGAVLASGEYDGEQETGGAAGGKKLSGRALYGKNCVTVIVEGPSDENAIGGILKEFFLWKK